MLKQPKKLRVIHILGDSEYGGGSKIVESIMSASICSNFDVSILSTNSKMINEAKKLGVNVYPLKCIKTNIAPISDILGIIKLYAFLKARKFDIVHTHTTKAGMIGRISSFFAGVPLIFHTVHGFAFSENSTQSKVKFYSIIEKICAKMSTKVVTVSNYHKNWAISLGIAKPEKFVAIPNGINNTKELARSDGLKVLFVGRMVREKGVEDLLRAFEQLIRSNKIPNTVVLELFGDGPDRSYFESLSNDLSIEGYVDFKGFVKQEQMKIEAGSIFVLPSYREGFSISLLEAMSLGLPIIATNIGGNKEALANGQAGLLYSPGNLEDLAQKLETLINNQGMAKLLSSKAQLIFEKHYSLDSMTRSYISLYKNSLGDISVDS